MELRAIFFGAIGTLVETSELQRHAFNMAFADADLDWVWDRDSYRRALRRPGGRARIADFAAAAGDAVDVEALYRAKTAFFGRLMEREGVRLRPGVFEVMEMARDRGLRLAFVTGTDAAQVDAVLAATGLVRSDFDWIGDRTRVACGKPAPDLYHAALADLGLAPDEAVAIEDTPESAEAALAAGLQTLGFPGEAAAGRSFPAGVDVVEALEPGLVAMRAEGRHAVAE